MAVERTMLGFEEYIIVGDGDETDVIKAYTKEDDVKLVVTGWLDNPYSYLKNFDLVMLLPRWEGFGLSIAEYIAAKKPVIATRIDAIPTLINDGVDGLMVDVDSPENVCEKAVYNYNHNKETEDMIVKTYQKALSRFDIQRVANQHVELMTELMGGLICRIVTMHADSFGEERRWAA